jgi:hypothetical protein
MCLAKKSGDAHHRFMSATAPVFLLSPAYCGGSEPRCFCQVAGNSISPSDAGRRATIGEVFSFLSGLYFRGKLAYGTKFGRSLVITPGRGLLSPDTVVSMEELRAIAEIGVTVDEPRYRRPWSAMPMRSWPRSPRRDHRPSREHRDGEVRRHHREPARRPAAFPAQFVGRAT